MFICNFTLMDAVASQILPLTATGAVIGAFVGAYSFFEAERAKLKSTDFDDYKGITSDPSVLAPLQQLAFFFAVSPNTHRALLEQIDLLIRTWIAVSTFTNDLRQIESIATLAPAQRDAFIKRYEQSLFWRDMLLTSYDNVAAKFESLVRDIELFNVYWSEMKDMFAASEANVAAVNAKIETIRAVLHTGLLPSFLHSPEAVSKEARASVFYEVRVRKKIMSWMLRHLYTLPALLGVARALEVQTLSSDIRENGNTNQTSHYLNAAPSIESSIAAKFGFWMQRAMAEGWSEVFNNPYAGFKVGATQDGYIPSEMLSTRVYASAARNLMSTFLSYRDTGVQMMSHASQHLVNTAVASAVRDPSHDYEWATRSGQQRFDEARKI